VFVSVIANQIRTPVDWISTGAIVLVTPAVSRVRWCGSCGRLAPFDTSISRAASTGDSRRNNRYVRVRFRARSCPRSLASSTDAAFPARHRTNHTALFERCSEAETSPRPFERGLLTHPRCLSRPQRRLSHDGQILRRHRQGRQGCVPDSSRPRA